MGCLRAYRVTHSHYPTIWVQSFHALFHVVHEVNVLHHTSTSRQCATYPFSPWFRSSTSSLVTTWLVIALRWSISTPSGHSIGSACFSSGDHEHVSEKAKAMLIATLHWTNPGFDPNTLQDTNAHVFITNLFLDPNDMHDRNPLRFEGTIVLPPCKKNKVFVRKKIGQGIVILGSLRPLYFYTGGPGCARRTVPDPRLGDGWVRTARALLTEAGWWMRRLHWWRWYRRHVSPGWSVRR